MTKEQKLKCNLAAAEFLGQSITLCDNGDVIFIPIKLLGVDTTTEFNIFTNPADCLAVVKKLGEQCVDILNVANDKFEMTGWQFYDCENEIEGTKYDTYEEAVSAACLDIKGGRE